VEPLSEYDSDARDKGARRAMPIFSTDATDGEKRRLTNAWNYQEISITNQYKIGFHFIYPDVCM